jgi:hypothetical protein
MKTRVSIAVFTLMFAASTAMLATQRGQAGGRPSSVGAAASSGAANDHRNNSNQSADHKPTTTGEKDSHGFRNYGQYVAATQISEHLHIPLADLQKAMVGDNLSLGDAIHKLQPSLSVQQVQIETKKAEAAAKKAEAQSKKSTD